MKTLILDIECSPHVIYSYDLWGKSFYTPPEKVIEESKMLSWAAKFTDSAKVYYMDTRTLPEEVIVLAVTKLMEKANIIVAHNAKFDITYINDRAAFYGIDLPYQYRTVCTYKISKKYAKTPFHKLSYLCNRYNKKYQKIEHGLGMDLPKGCLAGNRKMWKIMKEYNIMDVLALEELYVNTLSKWDRATINWIEVQKRKKKKCL